MTDLAEWWNVTHGTPVASLSPDFRPLASGRASRLPEGKEGEASPSDPYLIFLLPDPTIRQSGG
jgi:hypothetical protein